MTEEQPLILVVDDDRLVLATLVAGLKQAGFEVIEADNGDDAILLARKFKPLLAILDMRMQGKSGMDVARYLAANTATGFMFLSAFGDADIVEEATRMGALGYLVKPLDVRQIVPAVRAALGRWEEIKAAPPAVTADDAKAPVRDEYVAIGAHNDHVGTGGQSVGDPRRPLPCLHRGTGRTATVEDLVPPNQ